MEAVNEEKVCEPDVALAPVQLPEATQDVALVENHVIRDMRVIIEMDDVVTMRRKAMLACPQSAGLVTLLDENISHFWIDRFDNFKGIVTRPFEIPIITNNYKHTNSKKNI